MDVVVPRATPLTFGEKNVSFIDKSDQEIRERKFDLSRGGFLSPVPQVKFMKPVEVVKLNYD